MLVVISGLPGTGKTAVAEAVARETGSVHLSIDAVEDALLGAGLEASWTTGVAAYEAARAAAELNLALGRTVVVDAVNDSEPARDSSRATMTFCWLPPDSVSTATSELLARMSKASTSSTAWARTAPRSTRMRRKPRA